MTVKQINAYLKNTPLRGLGKAFVQAGRRYRVDPRLLVAIAGAESSFGKHQSGASNPFGWGPGIDFGSYGDAINTVARGLRENYLNAGLKSIPQIGSKYAPAGASNDPTNLNSNWSKNVSKFYEQLGGRRTSAAPGPVAAPVSPSAGPDLGAFAMENLSAISQGRYSPQESLANLAQSVALSVPSETPEPQTPFAGSVTAKGGITFSGQKFTHPTSGLAGYPAVDRFAAPGTPFLAPESGKIVRHSGRGGTKGSVYGYSVYFRGDSGREYFITHLGKNRAPVGRRLKRGQPVGVISPWESGAPHAHVGVKG